MINMLKGNISKEHYTEIGWHVLIMSSEDVIKLVSAIKSCIFEATISQWTQQQLAEDPGHIKSIVTSTTLITEGKSSVTVIHSTNQNQFHTKAITYISKTRTLANIP